MYANPKHIRSKRLNLSMTEVESRVTDAIAEFQGKQPAVLVREVFLAYLKQLGHDLDSAGSATEMRATQ